MASQPLVALGVDNTQPNSLGAYSEGQQAAATDIHNKIANTQQQLEMLGSGAMYALPNGLNGEVDPEKYHEVLDTFQGMGVDVSKYRDNPNFAKVAANAAIGALHNLDGARDERDYAFTMEKYKNDLEHWNKTYALDQQKVVNDTAAVAVGSDDAQAIGDAIIAGDQPPNTTGLYKVGPKVRAYLARNGFDMTKADQDYKATYRILQSMNGPQQTRLRQSISTLSDSLPLVEHLVDEWDGAGLKALNKAQLALAVQGVLGQKAQSIAVRLESQIKDVTAELANVYMGGNSPTEQALKLAEKQFSSDWDAQTLRDAIKQAKENIRYRQNSLNQPVAGISDTQYNPSAGAAAPGGGTAAPAADAGNDPMGLRAPAP